MQSAKEGTLDTASTKRPENIRREKRRSASRSPVRGMRRYFLGFVQKTDFFLFSDREFENDSKKREKVEESAEESEEDDDEA